MGQFNGAGEVEQRRHAALIAEIAGGQQHQQRTDPFAWRHCPFAHCNADDILAVGFR